MGIDRVTPAARSSLLDEKVSEIESEIVNRLLNSYQIKSIIARGSYGRDELSVKIHNDTLIFLSDIELIVIPKNRLWIFGLADISNELSNEFGIKVEITNLEPELYLLSLLNLVDSIPPSIEYYDLKYGSKVIYGENIPVPDRLPHYSSKDIPYWEGIRLLLNRMMESTYYYYVFCQSEQNDDADNLLYWIYKVVLACQDALLIMNGCYHVSYEKRNELFQQIFYTSYGALSKKVPGLVNLSIKATKFKLKPEDVHCNNIEHLWNDVAAITNIVFRYLIEENMGFTFVSYCEFQKIYLNNKDIRTKCYRGVSPNFMYQNVRSALKLLRYSKGLLYNIARADFSTPWGHHIYSIIPILYFNCNHTNLHNDEETHAVFETLHLFYGNQMNKSIDHSIDFKVVSMTLNLWKRICY